ncbi:MAG TPA: GxxExxY protein [Gemmatimonadaceae bacterium]|nr:GxxExxY protein [Gemmatimonadaceae bacterium]
MASRTAYPQTRLTSRIIGVYFEVYNELGAGFVESVYQAALAVALGHAGIAAAREVAFPVFFRGTRVGEFRADLLVEDSVLLELKAVPRLAEAHRAQLLNYLRASGVEVGLLLNFVPQPTIRRLVRCGAYAGVRTSDS